MRILIALGSNLPGMLGSPQDMLEQALLLMSGFGLDILRCSAWYRTPAIAPYAQPDFVNGVVVVHSALPPTELLDALHCIEGRLGRRRRVKWEERPVDLDLLDHGGLIIPPVGSAGVPGAPSAARSLELPHREIENRPFVLVPLADVAPDWRHPVAGKTALELLARLGPKAAEGIWRLDQPQNST